MQEMLPGFLAALSLSASLLLVPTLLTQVGAPFMGIYTASMLMAIAGTLAFGRLRERRLLRGSSRSSCSHTA